MTIEEVKTEIENRFPNFVVKSVVPYKSGYVVNGVDKKYVNDPDDVLIDPLFIDGSKTVIPFNPFTMDVSGYKSALVGIVYF